MSKFTASQWCTKNAGKAAQKEKRDCACLPLQNSGYALHLLSLILRIRTDEDKQGGAELGAFSLRPKISC